MTISGFIYGGLHALPWGNEFPTIKEKKLWQGSVLLVLAVGPLILLHSLLRSVLIYLEEKDEVGVVFVNSPTVPRFLNPLKQLRYLIYLVTCPIFLAYCFARAFLVVESVIALFHSTPDLYKMPTWSNYLLHIN